jgi:hypothetical protein
VGVRLNPRELVEREVVTDFQPVPDTAQFVLATSYGTGGVPMENIIHVRNTLIAWSSGSHLQDTADAIAGWYDAELSPAIGNVMTAGEVQARDLTTEFGGQATSAFIAGARTGERLPPQCFGLVQVKCDFGGAPRGGNWQHFGMLEADQELGQWTGAAITLMDDAWNALGPAVNAAAATDSVVKVSRFQGSTLVDFPDGTKRKVPTPRSPALTNTLRLIEVDEFVRVNKGRRFPGA